MDGVSHPNQYGQWYGVPDTPKLITRPLGPGVVDITRVRYDAPGHEFAAFPEFENAVLLHVQLRPMVADLSIDGARSRPLITPAGGVNILDLRRDLGGRMVSDFDEIIFHMPLSLYESLAAETRARPGAHAVPKPHEPLDDPTIRGLALSLIPALEHRRSPSALHLDQLGWALAAHVAGTYGGWRRQARPPGRLAPWQERRAKALMEANLGGEVRLHQLADACGLSAGYFARAFRRTTGMPPHRWLMGRRLDQARRLLSQGQPSLAEVALACGFADQSHFTRAFTSAMGETPGRWRRNRLN